MNSFQIFDASIPEDYQQWIRVWHSWPGREINAHPDYVGLFAAPFQRALCAVQQSDRGLIIFPFILRPLTQEAWYTAEEAAADVITPQGYSGPFYWGEPDSTDFWQRFSVWAQTNSVICVYARFSLFPEQLILFPGETETAAMNIVRALDLTKEAVLMDYDYNVRRNVKRALEHEVTVEIDFDGTRLDDFLAIYYDTMKRRSAPEYYYFDRQFFERLVQRLKGQYVFFHALYEEQVVSTELVLISEQYIYSFLHGTLHNVFKKVRPNDLLKHAIISWGIDQKKKAYILGGGFGGGSYVENDGIYLYKRSIAPRGEVPFRIGKLIYDVDAYEKAIALRRQWEHGNGSDWEPNPKFFPEYRS